MSIAPRAALALPCLVLLLATACRAHVGAASLAAADRDRLYAAVLRDLRRDSTVTMVVVDSLIPVRDFELELKLKALVTLALSQSELNQFLLAQQRPAQRFQRAALPDAHWRAVSIARVDTMRAAARALTAGAPRPAGRTGEFWTNWYRAYPGSGGYVILSPASVTRNGTMALVHVQIACGPTCSSTELRVLRRDGKGTWRTTGRVALWES